MFNRFSLLKNVHYKNIPYLWLFKTTERNFSKLIIPSGTELETKKEVSTRIMTKEDLCMVMDWAAKEGWNPGKYEVEPFYYADPRGYRLLLVDGVPVASLASVRHSAHFAFLGLYIVRPEYRGKGYGKLLWDIAMGTLMDCRTIGLNGVIEQVENYSKSGFKPATVNTRWRGKPSKELIEKAVSSVEKKKVSLTNDSSLTSIIDYDARIFSTPRIDFLSKWLTMPESHVLSAVDNGVLKGYGVVSASKNGYKIAPLFADDEDIAEKLYIALCQCIGNDKLIHLDTNENNHFAVEFAKRVGLEKTFNTLRMYKGEILKSDERKIFGITTLEIG